MCHYPIYPFKRLRSAFFVSFLVSVFFFAALSARCQIGDFSPVPENKEALTRLMGEYQQKYKQGLDKLPAKNRKDYVTIYGERWDNIKKYFDKEEIYTSPLAQAWLDSLVAEIVRGNPSLGSVPGVAGSGGYVPGGSGSGGYVSGGHVFRCFFSRSAVPNAAYVGEGIILFNMGLFDRLDNEAEAAFVICHEISHFLLRHPENSMDKYVATINSEEVQLQLHKIKNSEYRRNQQLEGMVKGIAFDSRRHSRDHESQADSMAVELLSHTRYGAGGAVATLAILDSIDTDTLNTGACLQRTFDSPKYRFQKKWITRDEGLLGGHGHLLNDATLEDSLKTHPDCQVRIKVLGPIIQQSAARANGGAGTRMSGGGGTKGIGGMAGGMSAGQAFVVDSVRFEQLKILFRYEEIEYAYKSDRYSLSLFLSLKLLQNQPGDPWLVAQVGRLLNGIYAAQKAHTLSKVADLPSPDYPANYNLLLQFIQNLYLDNIASINYNYLSQFHPQFDHNAFFKSVYEQSAGLSKP